MYSNSSAFLGGGNSQRPGGGQQQQYGFNAGMGGGQQPAGQQPGPFAPQPTGVVAFMGVTHGSHADPAVWRQLCTFE